MSSQEDSCVFCQILSGELTPDVVAYRDDYTVVFPSKDQRPGNEGHMLVVPLQHIPYLYDIKQVVAGPLMMTLSRVAAAVKALNSADGVAIRQHNEIHGGQDVFHIHFHVIPRYASDGLDCGENRYPEALVELPLAERIEQAVKMRAVLAGS